MTTQDAKNFERFIKKGVSDVVESERPVAVSGKNGARIQVKPKANGQRQRVFIRDKKGHQAEALSISFKKSDKLCLWFKRSWRVDSLAWSQKRKRCLACLKPTGPVTD
ncbi:MAG: hypothetical protein JKY56_07305 [Kofleriaceae bacterium]|nr:hypothetical protein [Kofleriaceae bacterium]